MTSAAPAAYREAMNPRITLESDEAAQRLVAIMRRVAPDFDARFHYVGGVPWDEFTRTWRDLPPIHRAFLMEVMEQYNREAEQHIEVV